MTDLEKSVAKRLIEKLLAGGFSISVYCEDELDVDRSKNFDKVFEYATASDYVTISTVAGSFTLIEGEIADHTSNPFCNRIATELEHDTT